MHRERVIRKLEDLACCRSLPQEECLRLIAGFREELDFLTFDDENANCMAILSDYAAQHPDFLNLILLRDREHLQEDTLLDLDLPNGGERHGHV